MQTHWAAVRNEQGRVVGDVLMCQVGDDWEPVSGLRLGPGPISVDLPDLGPDPRVEYRECPECGAWVRLTGVVVGKLVCRCTDPPTALRVVDDWVDAPPS